MLQLMQQLLQLSADTAYVLSAAEAAGGGSCPAITQDGLGLIGSHMAPNEMSTRYLSSEFRGDAITLFGTPKGQQNIQSSDPGPCARPRPWLWPRRPGSWVLVPWAWAHGPFYGGVCVKNACVSAAACLVQRESEIFCIYSARSAAFWKQDGAQIA